MRREMDAGSALPGVLPSLRLVALRRRKEGGQAMAELAVSLIGLMSVFLGLLLISAIGVESVENSMGARSQAAQDFVDGLVLASNATGQSILEWDYGTDHLQFTRDDSPVTASGAYAGESTTYTGELSSSDYIARATAVNSSLTYDNPYVMASASSEGSDHYNINSKNNFADNLSVSDFFLNAAELNESYYATANPLSKRKLSELAGAMKALIGDFDVTIDDRVYTPAVCK